MTLNSRTASAIVGVLIAFSTSAFSATPRDPAKYTRVLFPFHERVAAASGGWNVSWWIHNDGDVAADAFPLALPTDLRPPVPNGPEVNILGNPAIEAHATPYGIGGDVYPAYPSSPFLPVITTGTGAFLYVESARLPQLVIGGSVQFNSIQVNNGAVTPLHAIPENAFASGMHNILPISLLNGWRYALRIYALPETTGNPRVAVRVYEMQAQGPLISSRSSHESTRAL